MTSNSLTGPRTLLMSCILISACSQKAAHDYCRDHYLFHPGHVGEVGSLEITVAENGSVSGLLNLPAAIFSADKGRVISAARNLRIPGSIISLDNEYGCEETGPSVVESDAAISATFEAACSGTYALKQVDVSVFDAVRELEEVVVTVTTPATSKQFAISRQCDAAIFRLHGR